METIVFNLVMLFFCWILYLIFFKDDEVQKTENSVNEKPVKTFKEESKLSEGTSATPTSKSDSIKTNKSILSFEDLNKRSRFDTNQIPVVDEPEEPLFDEGYFDSLLSDEEYGISKSSYQSQNLSTKHKKCYQNKQASSVKSTRFKREITNFQIAALGIKRLYHFTDRSNLNSIKQKGGLYSWDWLERNNVVIPAQGGGSLSKNLDMQQGLENYVRLSFVQDHPMMYAAQRDGRINESALLEIDPQVILFEGALYSNMNATDRNATIGGSLTHLRRIDLNLIKSGEWSGEVQKKKFQAEVLVPEHIPLKYIKGL